MIVFNWRRIFGRRSRGSEGFLARLRRDERGNTLALAAAALIPMVGMVGSAVDISRAYLVKTRLQQACDAGVLAARRTMTGQSITGDTNAQTQATNFFNINLRPGSYGATITPISVTNVTDSSSAPTGAVHGTASASVPTTLMRIFGMTNLAMTAECEAQLQVSNNDVMFVLDVTGSMNCAAADTSSTCADNGLVEKSNARIKALRTAVVSFYDTLNAATTSGSQLRIGFVPYATTVNVGKLLPADYIADTWNYQSRVANFTTATYVAGTATQSTNVETYSSTLATAECDKYGANKNYPTTPGNGATFTTGTQAGGSVTTVTYAKKDWGATGTTNGTNRTCRRNVTTTTTPYTLRYAFTNWTLGSTPYNTAAFKAGSSVPIVMSPSSASYAATGPTPTSTFTSPQHYNEADLAANDSTVTDTPTTWTGCIEERATDSTQTTLYPIPASMYDLQIDTVPSSDVNTKWRTWWPELIWGYNSAYSAVTQLTTMTASNSMRNWFACPKQASKLAAMTHDEVYNYVNASDFKAVGFTYHDVGLIWGARLASATGIFGSENLTAPNGKPINRHIIFMTDGDMEPNMTSYNLYGHEYSDKRVTGTGGTNDTRLETLHNSRFAAICSDAKFNKNFTIWVVAYAQTMTTQLQNCASPGKAYYAGNDAALQLAFQNIANQIAQLRLSK